MAQLALIAASGPYSTPNLETSMIGGVPLATFRPLDAATRRTLREHAHDGRVYCWGSRPGDAGVRNWERLEPGDVALFYVRPGHFPLAGWFYDKVHSVASKKVARAIWGASPRDPSVDF